MAKRSSASNMNDCGPATPPLVVKSSSACSNDPKAIREEESSSISPRRRRSNRDVNSIRLDGVGRTAHTFYRRLRTLFFSNPSQEEYQTLFSNGSRRRKKTNERNTSSTDLSPKVSTREISSSKVKDAVVTTSAPAGVCSNPQQQNAIQVERATKPEEPAIYVIDNFLTDSELEYFDQKIASISFERSFVDNMGYEDDENDDGGDNQSTTQSKGDQQGTAHRDQNQNDTDIQIKTQNVSSVSNPNASSSQCPDKLNQGSAIKAKEKNGKGGKKRKKRKRRTIVDDSHRTSTFYSFRKLHDRKISALEQRIANILGCWVHQIEALQLVRYLPGQFFGVHHDLGNLLEDDSVELPRKDLACKRRLVTIFCYLNTLRDDEGGCTYFPKCGHLRVRPKRGRAVLWCNITEEGKADSRTIHAGEAVKSFVAEAGACSSSCTKNEIQPKESRKKSSELGSKHSAKTKKYGLNIWVCEE